VEFSSPTDDPSSAGIFAADFTVIAKQHSAA
jgi:hypothetical protein